MDVGRLLPGVQHEPQLDARVGDDDLDLALPGICHGLRQVPVLVGVEHAPDLVEVRICASRSRILSHAVPGLPNQDLGCLSSVEEIDVHEVAVTARPPSEVVGFRDPALGEDSDHSALFPRVAAAARSPTGGSRHDRFGSAASRNSAGSSTGMPP